MIPMIWSPLVRAARMSIPLTTRCRSRYVFSSDIINKRTLSQQSRTFSVATEGDILSRIKIRQVEKKDVPILFKIYDHENWNYSQETVEAFVDIAGKSFLVAELDGNVVGSMMANLLNDQEAFGGLAAVIPELRGKGIAKQLWAKRSEFIGERNFGVKSVLHREEILKKHGYSVSTYKCPLICGRIDLSTISVQGDSSVDIVPTSKVDFEALVKYDAEIHTIPRRTFVEKWLARPSVKSFTALDKSGNIVGYGASSAATHSYRICPLFADSSLVSRLLLVRLLQSVPQDANVDMYLNTENEVGKEIMATNKDTFKIAFEMRKMFTKRDVDLPQHHKILAYSSVELALV
ncbi:uncharacterized protein LOC106157056 isoform X2 [Lingula anatina]|nr:uncharacterized protein LOC106157056 isoform X2 [Lingula anatina]XP_013388006.1 uncharacterized protein LOC106157056 isoform X2 [Lingula anatina]XP_013388007.1 uncharacterized protein LOC106157056 isoform X2 [Lingula anatina]XP_013388008.1 uncharacterized protein LOC106157056 isoform X2 [Lingula anatina]XP_013388009.1 uncharacterized protein LOC106157056 isoform X2 [Lingula anatina]|eukprot:XP_013388005.1 uncharacterized protein LOC106157056 isoform X2 [Lingula anatina]